MKKQVVNGWSYPCHNRYFYNDDTCLQYRGRRVRKITLDNIVPYKKDIKAIKKIGIGCLCDKDCKPIRVTVTIEPEVNDENMLL